MASTKFETTSKDLRQICDVKPGLENRFYRDSGRRIVCGAVMMGRGDLGGGRTRGRGTLRKLGGGTQKIGLDRRPGNKAQARPPGAVRGATVDDSGGGGGLCARFRRPRHISPHLA